MKCKNCGKENRPGVNFCEQCGATLQTSIFPQGLDSSMTRRTCPSCGKVNREGVDFCEECGQNLSSAISQQSVNLIGADRKCPICGNFNREEVQFCEQCGASLSRMQPVIPLRASTQVCPVCGYANRSDVRFCENCGNDLSGMLEHVPVMAGKKASSRKWIALPLVGVLILFLCVGGWLLYRQAWFFIDGIYGFSLPANPVANQPQAPQQGGVAGITPEQNVPPEQGSGKAGSTGITPEQNLPPDTSAGSSCTDIADLIGESIEAGTVYPSEVGFTKTWIVENAGTCTWTNAYSLTFASGDQLGAKSSVNLPNEVQPGKRIMIPVDMVSPAEDGDYQGNWTLKNPSGETIGSAANSDTVFEVSIKVNANINLAQDPGSLSLVQEAELPAVGGGPGGFIDTDGDGLDDGTEDLLANAFVPYVEYDEHEDQKRADIIRFYQVTPLYKTYPDYLVHREYAFSEYGGPPGVLISYVYAYRYDSGDPSFGQQDHAGDTEIIRIFVVHPRDNPFAWIPAVISIKRHNDTPQFYLAGQAIYEDAPQQWINGTHLRVYASEDKHAFYIWGYECENYVKAGIYSEDCSGGYTLDTPITPGVDGFNVGERLVHPFSTVPAYPGGWYTSECVWSGDGTPPNGCMVPEYDASNNMKFVGYYDTSGYFCGGGNKNSDWDWFGYGPSCGGGLSGKWWPMSNANDQNYLAYYLGGFAETYYITQFGAQYEICFGTGKQDNAGTDFLVKATLWGDPKNFDSVNNRPMNWLTIHAGMGGYGSFARDSAICFNAGSYCMNEQISGISLYVYNDPYQYSEWYLDYVTVRDRFSNNMDLFTAYLWIDNANAYDSDIGQMTSGPSVYLERSKPPTPPQSP
jgi:hypothetical protein